MKQTIIIPRVSEKAYAQSANGVYVLRVPLNLNKNENQISCRSAIWRYCS